MACGLLACSAVACASSLHTLPAPWGNGGLRLWPHTAPHGVQLLVVPLVLKRLRWSSLRTVHTRRFLCLATACSSQWRLARISRGTNTSSRDWVIEWYLSYIVTCTTCTQLDSGIG